MASKLRLWACPCCGNYFNRRAHDELIPFCNPCQKQYVKRYTYPPNKTCRHERARIKLFSLLSVPRTVTRKRFRSTEEIRHAWEEVRAAKQIPAMLGRMNVFVTLVLDHARELPRCAQCGIYAAVPGDEFCEYCLGSRPRGVFHQYIITHSSSNTSVFAPQSQYHFGEAVGDYLISIDITRVRDLYDDMARMRVDLISILSKILDETARLPKRDEYNRKRLEVLRKMFPETELFRRSGPTRAQLRAAKLLEEARQLLNKKV